MTIWTHASLGVPISCRTWSIRYSWARWERVHVSYTRTSDATLASQTQTYMTQLAKNEFWLRLVCFSSGLALNLWTRVVFFLPSIPDVWIFNKSACAILLNRMFVSNFCSLQNQNQLRNSRTQSKLKVVRDFIKLVGLGLHTYPTWPARVWTLVKIA